MSSVVCVCVCVFAMAVKLATDSISLPCTVGSRVTLQYWHFQAAGGEGHRTVSPMLSVVQVFESELASPVLLQLWMNFRVDSFWYITQVEHKFQIFQSKQCLTISIFGHFPMMVHSRLSISFIQLHAICQETLYSERLTVFLIWKYYLPQTEGSFLTKNTLRLMTHICCSLAVLVCSQGMNGLRQTPQNLLRSCKTKYQMECLCLNTCV